VDTKEAIEFLEVEIKCLEKEIEICNPNDDIDIQVIEANKNIIIKYNQVIILLQQGEKYRQMWEELFKDFAQSNPDEHFIPYEIRNTMMEIEEYIEQKYFPKGGNTRKYKFL